MKGPGEKVIVESFDPAEFADYTGREETGCVFDADNDE